MSSGCGCKEVYTSYYLSQLLLYMLFLQQHPTFCSLKKKSFSFLFQYIFVIYLIIFPRSINKHTSDYGCPMEAI